MANIKLDAYIFFTGNCREAMEFYHGIFGGDLNFTTYGEGGGELPEEMAKMKDKIMHSVLKGEDIEFMGSDSTRDSFETSFISLSLSGTDEEKLSGYFNKLAEGGKITQAFEKAPWGDMFGALTDKYNVDWMVNVSAQ